MSTLLISEIFPPRKGGSGRWFYEIYRRLPPERFLVAAGPDPRQEAFDKTHALRLTRLPVSFSTWGLTSRAGLHQYGRALQTLWRLVAAERVNYIHAGRCLPEGLLALALRCSRGVPYLCYCHGEEMAIAAGSRELGWLARQVLRGAQRVIANSRNTVRLLQRDWVVPARRLRQLYPGVDTHRFVPAAPDPAVRQRLGWGRRPVVLTVSRLQPRKGHDQLITALPSIRQAVPDVLYAIVGDGEERPALTALVERERLADHVQFLGEVDDAELIHCYQQCDLFVLPNRTFKGDFEGFGMVLVEAQSCGKPVVAGTSGGTAETMRAPETGCMVDCTGPHQLAAVVTELLTDADRRARMGRAGRQWVVERFDWDALSRQALTIFAEP